MAGVPQVKLEQYINGAWVDLTSRLYWGSEAGAPVEYTRGVGDDGGVQPGSFTVLLANDDGALTPRNPASPHYPYLTRYRALRFQALLDGTWRYLFYGYIESEVVTWAGDETALDCRVLVTAIDVLGLASMRTLRSVAAESTVRRSPLAYWPLTDSETASATDISPGIRRPLAKQQWKTGGEVSWASGVALPTDDVGGAVFNPDGDAGVYLRTDVGLDLPTSWTATVWATPAAKDGYLLQVGTDQYSIGIWYDTSAQKFSVIETMLDASGDPVDYVLGTSTNAWAGGMETLTVTSSTARLGSAASAGSRHNSDRMRGSLVSVGGAMAVESGRARIYSGEVKHLAIWSGSSVPAGLADDVNTGPAALFAMSTAIPLLLSWAGAPPSTTTATLGSDMPVRLAHTEGMRAGEVFAQYALGSMSRIFTDRAGTVTVAAWDYTPAAVTAPSGDVHPEMEWAADPEGDVTEATVTWPDGATYTASETSAWGSSSADLPGILSQPQGRSVADWLVSTTDGEPRFQTATYDLLTLPDAIAAQLALLDPGAILTIPGLPSQLPAASQSGVVDQIIGTIGAEVWRVQIVTAADPRGRMLIAGDSTRGRVGQGWLTAPLGPDVDGGPWKAGDHVTHTALNANGYSGGLMQTGSVSVTPTPNTVMSIPVSFPSAFAATPSSIVVTAGSSQVGNQVLGLGVISRSASGFTLTAYRTNDTAFTVWWVAVE